MLVGANTEPLFPSCGNQTCGACGDKYVQFLWQLHGEVEGLSVTPGYAEAINVRVTHP